MKGRFDMKKVISAVISLMLILSSGASYSAADKYDYTVNGSKISAQPYYSGDVLMVPALETAEALGYINEYDASLGRLIIDDDYIQKAVLFKGSDEAFFNTVTVSGSSIDISPSMCEID